MDLDRLNSATKYPSILTYHEMGDRGRLKPVVQVPFPSGNVHLTEKVDGTNGRIIVLPSEAGLRHFIIGSREEFLTADGDLIQNPAYGIVKALEHVAKKLVPLSCIQVYFFEVFGGDLPASKQYTSSKAISIRLFDSAIVPLDVLERPIAQIAAWRDHGGQDFVHQAGFALLAKDLAAAGIPVERVPDIGIASGLPQTIEQTYEWLKFYEKSCCNLGGGKGRSEGIVARTADRKVIAKFRFEDYERTLGVKRMA